MRSSVLSNPFRDVSLAQDKVHNSSQIDRKRKALRERTPSGVSTDMAGDGGRKGMDRYETGERWTKDGGRDGEGSGEVRRRRR